jgi:hypothetical protein
MLNENLIPGGRAKLRQINAPEKHDFGVWKTGPQAVNCVKNRLKPMR